MDFLCSVIILFSGFYVLSGNFNLDKSAFESGSLTSSLQNSFISVLDKVSFVSTGKSVDSVNSSEEDNNEEINLTNDAVKEEIVKDDNETIVNESSDNFDIKENVSEEINITSFENQSEIVNSSNEQIEENISTDNLTDVINDTNNSIENENNTNVSSLGSGSEGLVNDSPSSNISFTSDLENVSEEIISSKVVLGEEVHWIKKVKVNSTNNSVVIKLPKEAKEISVKTGEKARAVERDILETHGTHTHVNSPTITGGVISSSGFFSSLSNFFDNLFLSGRVVDNLVVLNDSNETEVEVDSSLGEFVVEYYTPAPKSFEENLTNGKKVMISGPDSVHYKDVLAFTNLDENLNIENPDKIKIYWYEENKYIDSYNLSDLDGDGIYDYVEWIVPHLSNQTFGISITDADYVLSDGKTFVENIYNYVNETDNITYTIPEGDYARVYFESLLSAGNVIDFFARNENPVTINVYEKGSSIVFGSIRNVTTGMYYIEVNLSGSQTDFDLKSIGGDVVYDYIHDGSRTLTDDNLVTNSSSIYEGDLISVTSSMTVSGGKKDGGFKFGLREQNYPENIGTSCGNTFKINSIDLSSCSSCSNNGDGTVSLTADSNSYSVIFNLESCSSSSSNSPTSLILYDAGSTGPATINGPSVSVSVSPPLDLTLPVFTFISNVTLNNTDSLNFDIDATDEIAVDKFSINDTTNFAIDSSTGVLTNSTILSVGIYYLNVSVNDTSGNLVSEIIYIDVIPPLPRDNSFDGSTTNFSANIHALEHLPRVVLEKTSFGKINWTFSDYNVAGVDFDSNIYFEKGSVYVNSSNIDSTLNSSAKVSLYGLDVVYPIIYRNGAICENCSVLSYSGGDITFTVPGFSNYTVLDGTSLSIFDDSDSNIIGSTDTIKFYANYSNVTSGLPITGGDVSCALKENSSGSWSSPVSMNYNSGSNYYEYSKSISVEGTNNFNITCTNSQGYANLSSIDTFAITAPLMVSATGGTVTTIIDNGTNYTVRTFTSDGIFNVTTGATSVEVLVVGGGGGAGALYQASGAGAGGVVYDSSYSVTSQAYSVTVGAGGSGSPSGSQTQTNGSDSVFGNITAYGGGAGGSESKARSSGGSGAGGSHNRDYTGASATMGVGGEVQYGNSGGSVSGGDASPWSAAGGGGAGAAGQSVSSSGSTPGAGGAGIQFNISGTPTYYAGGGAGSNRASAIASGGIGGGGDTGTSGTANTGGGGGGGTQVGTARAGGAGGSGIVIIRYPTFAVYSNYLNANLNLTSANNYTVDNLTLNINSSYEANPVDWRINGSSLSVLNMPFDENSSVVKDYSTYENNGTNYGATWISSGKVGGAYSFDGTDYIEVDDNESLNITKDVTMAAWVKLNSDTSYQMVIVKPISSNSHPSPYFSYNLQLTSSGYPRTWITTTGNPTGATTSYPSDVLSTGIWYYVVGTYDGTKLCTYLDGSLLGSCNTGVSGDLVSYPTPLRLGTNGGHGEDLNGMLDSVLILNRSLSAEQIKQMYEEGLANHSIEKIVSNETSVGENWTAKVFGITGGVIRNSTTSNNVLIREEDVTAPIISVVSPINQTYSSSSITFSADANEAISQWIVNYNGTNVTISNGTSLTVEDGTHQLLFYGQDASGNWGLNDSIYFTVDTASPVISTPKINDVSPFTKGFSVKVNASVIDTSLDSVWLEVIPPISSSYNTSLIQNGNEFYDNFNLNENGDWQFRFYANDSFGRLVSSLAYSLDSNNYITVVTYGTLNVTLVSPTGLNNNQPQGETFNLRANVSCVGESDAICGVVLGRARYNSSSVSPDTYFSGSGSYATPFYSLESNSQSCGNLNVGDSPCQLLWTVNTTGIIGEHYLLDSYFSSDSVVSQNTEDVEIKIISSTLSIVLSNDLFNVNFGDSLSPGINDIPAVNNSNDAYNLTCYHAGAACNVSIKANGPLSSGINSIGIGNISWAKQNNYSFGGPMNLNYSIINSSLGDQQSQPIYFWLDLPQNIIAGNYKSNFTIYGESN